MTPPCTHSGNRQHPCCPRCCSPPSHTCYLLCTSLCTQALCPTKSLPYFCSDWHEVQLHLTHPLSSLPQHCERLSELSIFCGKSLASSRFCYLKIYQQDSHIQHWLAMANQDACLTSTFTTHILSLDVCYCYSTSL